MVFDAGRAYELLAPHFQARVQRREPLTLHSSFGVGGEADLWITVENQKELVNLISLCSQERWPLLAVGAGTNILYADAGVRGIVAQVRLQDYQIEAQADGSAIVTAEAGVRWNDLLQKLVPLGWGGMEFGAGIPGTLGAGVISNAGAHNQDLGQALLWIDVLDARGCNIAEEGEYAQPLFRRYEHDELELGYRHSRFREKPMTQIDQSGRLVLAPSQLITPAELIVTLALHLHPQHPTALTALIDTNLQKRRQIEPSHQQLGSIFKDPANTTARALIAKAGLGGKTKGKAQISAQNANYILNLGGASAQDIADLIIDAYQRVLEQSGVALALNIELLGEWSYPHA
ncbi:UDP-N-acetylenolpyruvoylglucosamine reductase [Dictyobacter alpinus]|uniref:UDP-N-acetylenolpyruvoylglucosamine reductase n=1 Tax=Dictyobacter alpinus TaxID=2014873 RepID=A0A402BK93_9CHLR|nr:UDP-N-acetylmuramate dehydrogenase [Dictyobacter alpinus]GCE31769.1 UDP-N-acetylenolpyruvoylglucosamine reductase [Dictyobacter alpinus]